MLSLEGVPLVFHVEPVTGRWWNLSKRRQGPPLHHRPKPVRSAGRLAAKPPEPGESP